MIPSSTSRCRSMSEPRCPKTLKNSEDGKSNDGNSRQADSDLVPMVRNCSSCLDLYHRMIGAVPVPRGITRAEERSGDGLSIGEPHEEAPINVGEQMGEANDYEIPDGSRGSILGQATTAGSCVFLYRKEANQWHVTRDWQDLFDLELVVVNPATRDQASGPSVPYQADFSHGGQDNDPDMERNNETEENTGTARRQNRFDKGTNTENRRDGSFSK